MEQLYQDYKDIAEFRIVYINEAHAADGRSPVRYAKEKGITEHDDYEERCTSAEMLINDKSLNIPCIIDGMDNKVNEEYKAWPDRIFLIRTDGRLAVAADRGPWGFAPALEEANQWLAEYKKTGHEPALPPAEIEANDDDDEPPAHPEAGHFASVVGDWNMETEFQGNAIEAVMTLTVEDGDLIGTWASMGMEMSLSDVMFADNTLTFKRAMGTGGASLAFQGIIKGNKIAGRYSGQFGELTCTGERQTGTLQQRDTQQSEQAQPVARDWESPFKSQYPIGQTHKRPIIDKDGKTLLWAKGDPNSDDAEWFDMTAALVDPAQFQFGIGKDRIPPIDEPEFVSMGDAQLAQFGITDNTRVVGYEFEGEARAYPIKILDRHEVVNDKFEGVPFAVCW